uniref:Uncharacterized protein n=1 Tax=Siphoviridae sp. ctRcp9 TaxID=2825504 RepID=A0A8S5PKK0_9CAUD|nr:MAG TPA: hypothetical protein [Siphoviridae sp. ctRcp9]
MIKPLKNKAFQMVHIFRKSRTNLLLFYFAQLCYKVVKKYEI